MTPTCSFNPHIHRLQNEMLGAPCLGASSRKKLAPFFLFEKTAVTNRVRTGWSCTFDPTHAALIVEQSTRTIRNCLCCYFTVPACSEKRNRQIYSQVSTGRRYDQFCVVQPTFSVVDIGTLHSPYTKIPQQSVGSFSRVPKIEDYPRTSGNHQWGLYFRYCMC